MPCRDFAHAPRGGRAVKSLLTIVIQFETA
jgi:hypothetical protein